MRNVEENKNRTKPLFKTIEINIKEERPLSMINCLLTKAIPFQVGLN